MGTSRKHWQASKSDLSPRKEYVPEVDEFFDSEDTRADIDDYLHDVSVEKELEKRDGVA
jgi:hypothetical protein